MLASTHYETLGVSPSAEPAVVRAAYKVLIQTHHPDRHHGEAAARAHARTLAINAAWAVLADPVQRQAYDATLTEKAAAVTGPTPDSMTTAAHEAAMAAFTVAQREAARRQRGAATWAQAAVEDAERHVQTLTNPTAHDLLAQWLDARDQVLATRLVRAGAQAQVRLSRTAHVLQVAYDPVAQGGGHYTAAAWQRLPLTGEATTLPAPPTPTPAAMGSLTWAEAWQGMGIQRWWLVPLGAVAMALGAHLA